MRIVAIALGTYGDVEPFAVLGEELLQRGHDFRLVAFASSADRIREQGIEAVVFPGDCAQIVKKLYDKQNTAQDIGNVMAEFFSGILENRDTATRLCANADLILYMQFGAFIRHYAEKMGIPCIRTSVFPDTKTRLYAPLHPHVKRGSIKCSLSYDLERIAGNMLGHREVNQWRAELGLKKISVFTSDRKTKTGTIPTLYQYSPVLVPPDPNWDSSVQVTGTWSRMKRCEEKPNAELERFIQQGPVIYIGFGSMYPQDMEQLQETVEAAIELAGIRAVISLHGGNFKKRAFSERICYVDFVSYDWLFSNIKGVVCHGGCGTVHKALEHGLPVLVLAFGGDQLFFGQQVEVVKAGPKPVDMKEETPGAEVLAKRFLELLKPDFAQAAGSIGSAIRQEDGCRRAADFIERYLRQRKGRREDERERNTV